MDFGLQNPSKPYIQYLGIIFHCKKVRTVSYKLEQLLKALF